MYGWLDIHTHNSAAAPDVYTLRNVHENFEAATFPCSMGLHPWYLQEETSDTDMAVLRRYAAQPQVKAIGECGLDKITDTPWALQVNVFRLQVQLAMHLHKPLIIHCVRAWNELLQLLQEERVNVPVIFHGFNKKPELAEQLFRAGYYLSFGAALLRSDSNAAMVMTTAPMSQVFLETDDSKLPVIDIYKAVAGIRNSDINTIVLQLQQNAATVFSL